MFSHHEPCPKCGSKDNLGVWKDGHKWCFGCGYKVNAEGMSIASMEATLKPVAKNGYGELPYDISVDIPKEPYKWLMKYALTKEQISDNKLYWSARNEMLIIPYFDGEGKCILWQGRYFPERKPKVFTSGNPNYHILTPISSNNMGIVDTICVVEDPISAIKVNDIVVTTTLLGSNISKEKAVMLARYYDNLIIWLDFDKVASSLKFSEMYKNLFQNVTVVVTEKDPKELSLDEIKEKLNVNKM